MSVAFDTKFQKASGSTASPFSYVSNAGTVAGSIGANNNRALIVALTFRGIASSAVSVTWNGVAMTQIGSKVSLAGTFELYLFGLIAPDTGAQTISASWTGGIGGVCLGGISVYNADQTTGWQNYATNTATSTSATVAVTTANGNMVAGHNCDNNALSWTQTSGTKDWDERNFDGNFQGCHKASTGSSESLSGTLGSSVAWAMQGVDVIVAATADILLAQCCL